VRRYKALNDFQENTSGILATISRAWDLDDDIDEILDAVLVTVFAVLQRRYTADTRRATDDYLKAVRHDIEALPVYDRVPLRDFLELNDCISAEWRRDVTRPDGTRRSSTPRS
jgi:hypothetical protein